MKLDTRNQMIKKLIDDLDSWDEDTLREWAKNQMEELLRHMDPQALKLEYEDKFGDK